ncbi:MAG TPA: PGF-pre-PGF domain-containing protein [Candidatus Methanoperedens sp.]
MSFLRREILLVFILSACPAISAALPAEISINPAYQSIENGQEFNIDILIDPVNNPITGAQFNLNFDNSLVNIKNVSEGNLFKQNGTTTAFNSGSPNNADGTLINVWGLIIIPGSNVSTKGTLATILMTATGEGMSALNLSNVIISDPASQEVQVNITNGSVDVTSSGIILQTNSVAGGGGGGGGGGGASAENYTNIEFKEKYDLFIYKDVTTAYSFRKKGNPITGVNIIGNVNAGEINAAVEVLRDRSTLIDASPDGIIYKNVNIWLGTFGFATPKNIKDATITFRVDISWIEENGIDPASITLMRYSSGGWKELPTEKTGEDDGTLYYEVKTDGFSHFAITGKKSEVQVYNEINTLSQDTAPSQTHGTMIKDRETMESKPDNTSALSVFMLVGTLIGSTYNASLVFFKMIKPGLN